MIIRVIDADFEQTGGGTFTYFGKYSNGNYFLLSQNSYMSCDADPRELFTEEFFEESGGDTSEWEKKHIISNTSLPADDDALKDLIKEAFRFLKKKYGTVYDWDDLARKELLG